jgi:hypothetical protein
MNTYNRRIPILNISMPIQNSSRHQRNEGLKTNGDYSKIERYAKEQYIMNINELLIKAKTK